MLNDFELEVIERDYLMQKISLLFQIFLSISNFDIQA